MSSDNLRPIPDIKQAEHENVANAKRVVLHGKTSGGVYVPLLLKSNGAIEITEELALTELSDVAITSPADNEILAYDSASGEWINQTPSEAGFDAIYLKLNGTSTTTVLIPFAQGMSVPDNKYISIGGSSGHNIYYDANYSYLTKVYAKSMGKLFGFYTDVSVGGSFSLFISKYGSYGPDRKGEITYDTSISRTIFKTWATSESLIRIQSDGKQQSLGDGDFGRATEFFGGDGANAGGINPPNAGGDGADAFISGGTAGTGVGGGADGTPGIVVIGRTNNTSHSLDAIDDLLVGGELEVDGTLWADGDILPGADETQDLGSSSLKFEQIWGRKVYGVNIGPNGGTITQGSSGGIFANVNASGGTIKTSTDPGNMAIGHIYSPYSGTTMIYSGNDLTYGKACFAQGLVYNYNSHVSTTGGIYSRQNGSFAQGGIYFTGASQIKAQVYSNGAGAFAQGYISASANAYIKTSGNGSFAQGYISTGGDINATGSGCFAQGGINEADAAAVASIVAGTNPGAFAQGYVKADEHPSYIKSTAKGSFAQGYCNAQSSGGFCYIESAAHGAFAQGIASANTDGYGKIRAGGVGSFAQGQARATNGFKGYIQATGVGSFAQGRARGTSANTYLNAIGIGSFAHGYAFNQTIEATAKGAFAVGFATGGNISAMAENAFQFGVGSNSLADSLQVGNAGLRMKGTTGAPGTPQNGDVWVNNNYVYIRSNGVSVKIT